MERVIWVIGNDRKEMLEVQRRINSTGSMRALCLLSTAMLERAIDSGTNAKGSRISSPSLIVVDYDTVEQEDFLSLSMLKNHQFLAGVPLFFMVKEKTKELDEKCFSFGGTVVLRKPFSKSAILRIERMAWQQEVTKNYEKTLQKQASELQAAREIMRLNKQLEARNELLYQVFGRYFSDEVLEVILQHPEEAVIGGEKRELTVMLSDLRGFTSMSEELDPESVTKLLNYYFGKMVEVIAHYHGTVIEFLGDGVLAVFGAPLNSKESTADAVAAAIEMQNCMDEVNAYCDVQGFPQLQMGIGIHHGEAFIGNVGSEKMMRYNVLGQVVNECSRIESCSVGGQVLVSTKAVNAISCPVEIQNQREITAKGIHRPVSLCEVVGIGGEYQCYIGKKDLEQMKSVEDEIALHLYHIEGKQVAEKPVITQLIKFSRNRAVVTIKEQAVERYSDVQITAVDHAGNPLFNGVYAKVIDQNKEEAVLHFTHVTETFRKCAEDLLSGEEGMGA